MGVVWSPNTSTNIIKLKFVNVFITPESFTIKSWLKRNLHFYHYWKWKVFKKKYVMAQSQLYYYYISEHKLIHGKKKASITKHTKTVRKSIIYTIPFNYHSYQQDFVVSSINKNCNLTIESYICDSLHFKGTFSAYYHWDFQWHPLEKH